MSVTEAARHVASLFAGGSDGFPEFLVGGLNPEAPIEYLEREIRHRLVSNSERVLVAWAGPSVIPLLADIRSDAMETALERPDRVGRALDCLLYLNVIHGHG